MFYFWMLQWQWLQNMQRYVLILSFICCGFPVVFPCISTAVTHFFVPLLASYGDLSVGFPRPGNAHFLTREIVEHLEQVDLCDIIVVGQLEILTLSKSPITELRRNVLMSFGYWLSSDWCPHIVGRNKFCKTIPVVHTSRCFLDLSEKLGLAKPRVQGIAASLPCDLQSLFKIRWFTSIDIYTAPVCVGWAWYIFGSQP